MHCLRGPTHVTRLDLSQDLTHLSKRETSLLVYTDEVSQWQLNSFCGCQIWYIWYFYNLVYICILKCTISDQWHNQSIKLCFSFGKECNEMDDEALTKGWVEENLNLMHFVFLAIKWKSSYRKWHHFSHFRVLHSKQKVGRGYSHGWIVINQSLGRLSVWLMTLHP